MSSEGTKSAGDSLYLLRVEGQNFRWTIDDTHDLSTIAGGSRMLAHVPERVESRLKRLAGSGAILAFRTIQQAASIGLFAVYPGSQQMPSILRDIRKSLGTFNFRHLSVSAEAIEVGMVELIEEDNELKIPLGKIGIDLEKRLIAASRFGQMRAPSLAVPAVVENVNQACCEDHVRPAERNGKLQRSASVLARRELGKYFRWKSGDGDASRARTVYYFDHMTSYPSNPHWHGKLAVITIDGKGFTKLRNDLCRTAADLKQFSDKLSLLQNTFHIALMGKWASNEHDDRYFYNFIPKSGPEDRGRKPGKLLRFQRLVMAGDDATYLMPAWLAWEFLSEFFSQRWELEWRAQTEEDETFALAFRAGVVICHAKAPIHPIRDLALKLESEVAAEDGKSLRNPIAYEVLKSFDFIITGLDEYRKQKRVCLEPHEALLDGNEIVNLESRLRELKEKASSGEIKTPLRWGETLKRLNDQKFQKGDLYHLSQWRDYIFED